jgi:long-chain acyl-CoA synthetase
MEKQDTIPQIIKSNSIKWGSRAAMSMKMLGIWHNYSWQDYYENVKYFSLGMITLGLQHGDVACIIGDNEPQWFCSRCRRPAASPPASLSIPFRPR